MKPRHVHRPTVVFDFDGTLANSIELAIEQYNLLASRYRVKSIDRTSLARLRKLGPAAALKEHRIAFWKLPWIVRAMRRAMHQHVDHIDPMAGIIPALHALTASGVRCSILSTNSSENIARFLARHDLTMFEHVAGGASMFGKAGALKRLMRKSGIAPSSVFYVGDEVRDLQAATKAGVASIAVGWGYGDCDALLAEKPTHLVHDPAELVTLLQEHGSRVVWKD